MANSVDPDEMAQYLHCLQKYLFWSIGLEGLEVVFDDNSWIIFLISP